MAFDLRTRDWIPFRRSSGAVECGPPDLLVDAIEQDPVVALATPRPDFDAALTEFLIGLLTAAFAVEDEESWRELWRCPPNREALQQALLALPDAFDLDGAGPRFFQDLSAADLAKMDELPIQDLLIGGKDARFVKPDTVSRMGRPAAAMALLTLQTYAPEGGRGHMTSMRGGGPLTTLVDPRPSGLAHSGLDASLWRLVWSNVLAVGALAGATATGERTSVSDAFPWLAATRSSEGKARLTTPVDASPLQAFFGMPRRIRLSFLAEPGRCDLTGRSDDCLATGFRMKSYGVQYRGWTHPLSPYSEGKAPNEWHAVHPKPGGVAWRDWYSFLYDRADGKRRPARVVAQFTARRAEPVLNGRRFSLRVAGFAMKQDKARAWIGAVLPGFAEPDPERLRDIESLVTALVESTEIAAYAVQRAVQAALYGGSEAPSGDLAHLKEAVWERAGEAFFRVVLGVPYPPSDRPALIDAEDVEKAATVVRREFADVLADVGTRVYDEHVDADGAHPEQMRRAVIARSDLVMTLRGRGKEGAKLLEKLGMSQPQPAQRRTTAKGERA